MINDKTLGVVTDGTCDWVKVIFNDNMTEL
jgi:hypothetical protein